MRNLLNFSRQEVEEEKDSLKLEDVITKSLSIIKLNARQHDVEIVLDFDKDIPSITGDINKLQQVVLNVASNSMHAMKEKGGKLYLSTFTNPERSKVFMQIRDTGIGIDKKDINRIFDPYYTTKQQGEGTGL
ncbi:MAG: two-component sensor histidine kinase, partial [Deltaproteobacteria bacterium]|nr:two-component sensor histidine kinase [Deltaproteobacteria bacterium]